jgi:GAF domain-containing protein
VPIDDAALNELMGLAGLPLAHDDLPAALSELCRIAVRVVPRAEGASFTSFTEAGPGAAAASDPWAASLDELQYTEHEGPCLDGGRTGVSFRVRDTAVDPRWPSYMPRALELGARSMMSLPMTTESKVIGALNLYSRSVDAFDAEAVALGELFAGHASLASQVSASLFDQRQLAEQLRDAMRSRATIEQAKGILMATTRCDPEQAFELMVQQSQHQNRKLREIAEELVSRHIGPMG